MVMPDVVPLLSPPALSTMVGTESMFHCARSVGAACAGPARARSIVPAAAAVVIQRDIERTIISCSRHDCDLQSFSTVAEA
jgi:hypothetical protein